jgi:hypothetical protein
MNNNFANLLDKSYCIIKNLLDTTDINLIKQDFNLIKTEKFLNPNFNILPVGKKISIDSTISCFGCVSCFWQDLQDLFYLVVCIPFQYFTDCVVFQRLEWLGC